jgi:hypothetical protein
MKNETGLKVIRKVEQINESAKQLFKEEFDGVGLAAGYLLGTDLTEIQNTGFLAIVLF